MFLIKLGGGGQLPPPCKLKVVSESDVEFLKRALVMHLQVKLSPHINLIDKRCLKNVSVLKLDLEELYSAECFEVFSKY